LCEPVRVEPGITRIFGFAIVGSSHIGICITCRAPQKQNGRDRPGHDVFWR
jgi:hypothetical protein